jgi:hypothetical protein
MINIAGILRRGLGCQAGWGFFEFASKSTTIDHSAYNPTDNENADVSSAEGR